MSKIILALITGVPGIVFIFILAILLDDNEKYKIEYNGEIFYTENMIMTSYGCCKMYDLGIEVCGNFKKELVK